MAEETTFSKNPIIDWDAHGIRLPHGAEPGSYPGGDLGGHNDWLTSRAKWEAYQWNPPQNHVEFWPDPDPSASLKPTWDDIVLYARHTALGDLIAELDQLLRANAGLRDKIAREIVVNVAGGPTGIGRGFDHLTSLVHLVEHGNHAGEYFPHVQMRRLDGTLAPLYLQREARAVLAPAALYKNQIESAHNALASEYLLLEKVARDKTKPLEEREVAAAKSLALRKAYPGKLKAAAENFDPYKLPDTLEARRGKRLEMLEADAMRHVIHLKGVVSQQGADLPPSCNDEADALQAVASAQRLGFIAIIGATDIAAVDAAYNAAKAKIEAVQALHVPELFDAAGDPVTAEIAVEQAGPVKLEARQPAGQDIPGAVAVTVAVPGYVAGAFTSVAEELDQDGGFARATIALSAPENAGDTAEYRVEARNLCGPARALTVKITRPEAVVQPV